LQDLLLPLWLQNDTWGREYWDWEHQVQGETYSEMVPRYMERHREKAGIAGWAQVNGLRGNTSIMERTKYDLYYIENWSLWFDFKIMILTALKFFRDRSAY
jgi:lipopolysaccharide/colanic/teichoic acid biosynthesis glycosyltransferase